MVRNLLKAKMALKEKNYKDCSKALGMTESNYAKKMNNQVPFSVNHILKLSKFLNLSLSELNDIFLQ